MSFESHYDRTKQILYCTVRGAYTMETFYATVPSIAQSTEFPPDSDTLWDLRQLIFDGLNADFMKQLVAARKAFPERRGARLALIVEGDLAFGLTRMYEMISDAEAAELQQQMRAFRSLAAGEQWLLESRIDQ
jgi:hypothetical protein